MSSRKKNESIASSPLIQNARKIWKEHGSLITLTVVFLAWGSSRNSIARLEQQGHELNDLLDVGKKAQQESVDRLSHVQSEMIEKTKQELKTEQGIQVQQQSKATSELSASLSKVGEVEQRLHLLAPYVFLRGKESASFTMKRENAAVLKDWFTAEGYEVSVTEPPKSGRQPASVGPVRVVIRTAKPKVESKTTH